MDDLISRQAAIDAINCEVPVIGGQNVVIVALTIEMLADRIKALPSAQPEQRWIPVSERLPDENGRYLCTNSAWGAYEVDWNAWLDGAWLYPNNKPIAWMPLPEAYREGEKDETN